MSAAGAKGADPVDAALRLLRDGVPPADAKKQLRAAGFKTKTVLLALRDAKRLIKKNAGPAATRASGKTGITAAASFSPASASASLVSHASLLSAADPTVAQHLLLICGDSTTSSGDPYTLDDVKVVLSCFALRRRAASANDADANEAVHALMGGVHMPTWRAKLEAAALPPPQDSPPAPPASGPGNGDGTRVRSHVDRVDEVCAIVLGAANPSSGEPYTRADVEDVCMAYRGSMDELVVEMLGGLHMPTWRERARPLRQLRDIRASHSGRTFDCPICLSVYPIEETFSFDCVDAHRACVRCVTSHVRSSLQERNLPRCIGCQYDVSTIELKQIENQNQALLLAEPRLEPGVGGGSKSAAASSSSDAARANSSPITVTHDGKTLRLSSAKENLEMQVYMRNQDDVRACSAPNCPGYVACLTPGQVERCVCPVCDFCYCGVCLQMYHYGTRKCADVPSLRRKYEHWKREGRLPYLKHMATQREEMQAQLKEYEKKKAAHDRDAKVAEQMRLAELADEKYKEENCFHCPKCNRLMEWLAKCNWMVCGRDYHGGNQQDGCGHKFDKTKARKYKSTGVQRREVGALDVSAPDFQALKHEIVAGTSIRCDDCREDIVGPRFECIHCPAYNLCARCESKLVSSGDDGHGAGGERKRSGGAPTPVMEGKSEMRTAAPAASGGGGSKLRGDQGGATHDHNLGRYRAHVFRLHIN